MRTILIFITILFSCVAAQAQTQQFCVTSPSQTANYNQLCISASSTGGALTLTNNGSATGSISISPFSITPPSGTTTAGLTITQTGPSGAGAIGNVTYNSITVTSPTNYGNSGQGAFALRILARVGGTNSQGLFYGLFSDVAVNSATVSNGDMVGVVPRCVFTAGVNSTIGGCYGANPQGILTGNSTLNATNGEVAGSECDARIDSGSSAAWRFGCAAVSTGPVQGALLDAAYEVGSSSAGWGNAILLNSGHGQGPLATTGCVICTDGAANTIATGLDLSSYTLTGKFLNFKLGSWNGATGAISISTIGTGFTQSSANTAGDNTWTLTNTGTSSNAATRAVRFIQLGCGSCYLAEVVSGGASPQAFVSTGAGLTAGFAFAAGAGPVVFKTSLAGAYIVQDGNGVAVGDYYGTTASTWTFSAAVVGTSTIKGTGFIATAAAPTVAAAQIGYGSTVVAAGAGTCPTGTVGGQTVAGCIVVNIAGTAKNVPYF